MTPTPDEDTESHLAEMEAGLRAIERLARVAVKHVAAIRGPLVGGPTLLPEMPAAPPPSLPANLASSQHERIRMVKETIQAIEDEAADKVALFDVIVARMQERGMAPADTQKAIEHLERVNFLYRKRPPTGYGIVK